MFLVLFLYKNDSYCKNSKKGGKIMLGIIFSVVAGAAMSIQGVMNTRLGEKIGIYEANVIIAGLSFVVAIIAFFIMGNGNFKEVANVNKIYLLGGVLGYAITITVMLAIGKLSPSVAVSIILVSQLAVAAIIEAFGIMDSDKVAFLWNKYVGLMLMVGGILLFKWK